MELRFCEELSNFVPSNGEGVFAIMGRHKKGQIYASPFHVIQFSWNVSNYTVNKVNIISFYLLYVQAIVTHFIYYLTI